MRRRHPFARGGDHETRRAGPPTGLAKGSDKAFIGGHQPGKPVDQIVQQPDVMGPGGQEGKQIIIPQRAMRSPSLKP